MKTRANDLPAVHQIQRQIPGICNAIRYIQPCLLDNAARISGVWLLHSMSKIVKDAHSSTASFFTLRFGSAAAIIASTSALVIYSGAGAGAEGGRFLQPGDEVVCAIEGIGELRNTVE